MEIISSLEDVSIKVPTCVTIGTFDGVHLGHKKIISRITQDSKNGNLKSLVFTFKPHPRLVLFPDEKDLKLLNTYSERKELFRIANIDYLIELPFTEEFSQIDPKHFIHKILSEKLNMKKIVIGYDHRFGKNRSGSINLIKDLASELDYEVEEISVQEINDINISSTRIRKALESGNIKQANSFLGYSYFLTGTVVKGKQLGRLLGYPTANIDHINPLKLIPPSGVYAVLIEAKGNIYSGMMNIGINPTTDKDKKIKIEVNIFDFNDELYGDTLKIFFIDFVRYEKKFSGIDELKVALREDKIKTLEILKA